MKIKSTLTGLAFAVVVTINVAGNAQSVNVDDSLALVALYNSANGPNWRYSTNWLTGPVATWYGITVSEASIIKIDLHRNKLRGDIPAKLGNLVNLSYIDLGENHLGGDIPP